MTVSIQQHADLAAHSYEIPEVGKERTINNINYRVLEYYSDEKTDYQGTIYQRVDTGEIIVAHRGTETTKGDIAADYEMATKFTNPQIPHALRLTEIALQRAEEYAKRENVPIPEVSITGHSLGGALAQVTAYEYDLKAMTFNAYGAANLTYTNLYGQGKSVPHVDNGKIVNHMMAGDVVSAGNDHLGKNEIYIRAEEVVSLEYWNYGDGKDDNNWVKMAAATQMTKYNAHTITNFTDEDGPSILSNSIYKYMARANAEMIDEYRSDVRSTKGIVADKATKVEEKIDNLQEKINDVKEKANGVKEGWQSIKDFFSSGKSPQSATMTQAGYGVSEESTSLLVQLLDTDYEKDPQKFRELCEAMAQTPENKAFLQEGVNVAMKEREFAQQMEQSQQQPNRGHSMEMA